MTVSYTDRYSGGKRLSAVSAEKARTAPVTNTAPQFPPSETGIRSVPENTPSGRDIGSPVTAEDAEDTALLLFP